MSNPKILFYDIETAPNLAYVWGQYEQNVIEQVREWYIMCFSYKWAGQKKAKSVALPDFKMEYAVDPEDDLSVCEDLWQLFDQADIVVAHNGDRFDMRKANARFIDHGLGPPSPVKQIDTLKIARKHFMFNSNKLGDLGQHLGLGAKVPTGGFELWKGCMRGDPKSWAKMVKYAKQDTDLLERVYLEMRPWMTTHPSLSVISGKQDACPRCNSVGTLTKSGFKYTSHNKWQIYQCSNCKGYPKSRVAEEGFEKPHYV